jgi:hypothetical protein
MRRAPAATRKHHAHVLAAKTQTEFQKEGHISEWRCVDGKDDPQAIEHAKGNWLGAPGFEPRNGGIKIRCLTTWLGPNAVRRPAGPRRLVPDVEQILDRDEHPRKRAGLDAKALQGEIQNRHPRPRSFGRHRSPKSEKPILLGHASAQNWPAKMRRLDMGEFGFERQLS